MFFKQVHKNRTSALSLYPLNVQVFKILLKSVRVLLILLSQYFNISGRRYLTHSNKNNTITYINLKNVLLWMSALISGGFQSVWVGLLCVCVRGGLKKEAAEAVRYFYTRRFNVIIYYFHYPLQYNSRDSVPLH